MVADIPLNVPDVLAAAASVLEAGPGLAKLATIKRDHHAGKLSVFDAIQDVLWPPPGPLPYPSGIPQSSPNDSRCALYWASVAAFGVYCGGTGDWPHDEIDAITEAAEATSQTVAAHLRAAAARQTDPPRPPQNQKRG